MAWRCWRNTAYQDELWDIAECYVMCGAHPSNDENVRQLVDAWNTRLKQEELAVYDVRNAVEQMSH